jgi:hypothetical protein
MINTLTTQLEEVKYSKKRKISEILASVVDDPELPMIDTSSTRQPAKRRKLNERFERPQNSQSSSRSVISED